MKRIEIITAGWYEDNEIAGIVVAPDGRSFKHDVEVWNTQVRGQVASLMLESFVPGKPETKRQARKEESRRVMAEQDAQQKVLTMMSGEDTSKMGPAAYEVLTARMILKYLVGLGYEQVEWRSQSASIAHLLVEEGEAP